MESKRKRISSSKMTRWLETTFDKATIRTVHKRVTMAPAKRNLSKSEMAGFHLKLAMGLANAPEAQFQRLVNAVDRVSRIGFAATERARGRHVQS